MIATTTAVVASYGVWAWITGIMAVIAGAVASLAYTKIGPFAPKSQELDDFSTPVDTQQPPAAVVDMPAKVYEAAKAALGSHLTLNTAVNPETGCAEAVSTILSRCGYKIPAKGIPTVNGLIDWMLANGFEECQGPGVGYVITAHRANHNDPNQAHTGIIMNYGVASNDSRPQYLGRFLENYSSVAHWVAYYDAVDSVTRYFKPC